MVYEAMRMAKAERGTPDG
jgi:hypothetical protein